MPDANRPVTSGEAAIIRSVFGISIPLDKVRIHSERWLPGFPTDRAMAPNGHIYFPGDTYRADFAVAGLYDRSVLVHESTHLYQYYSLGWSLILRGPFDRDYEYELVKDRPFSRYGLEEMGMIAQHFYTLREGGVLPRRYQKYVLADYAPMLPIR
jgi:hypothetical protein